MFGAISTQPECSPSCRRAWHHTWEPVASVDAVTMQRPPRRMTCRLVPRAASDPAAQALDLTQGWAFVSRIFLG